MNQTPKNKNTQTMSSTTVPTVAASMKQAAKIWEIPLAAIKLAKAAGCPGFERQRVHRAPLLKWLVDHPEALAQAQKLADTAQLKTEKLRLEVAHLTHKHKLEIENSFPVDEFKTNCKELVEIIHEEAAKLLENDMFRIFSERVKSRLSELEQPIETA